MFHLIKIFGVLFPLLFGSFLEFLNFTFGHIRVSKHHGGDKKDLVTSSHRDLIEIVS